MLNNSYFFDLVDKGGASIVAHLLQQVIASSGESTASVIIEVSCQHAGVVSCPFKAGVAACRYIWCHQQLALRLLTELVYTCTSMYVCDHSPSL